MLDETKFSKIQDNKSFNVIKYLKDNNKIITEERNLSKHIVYKM